MDFGGYCDCTNGGFVIHFPNFDKISEEELEEMFTSYGPATVHVSNNETDLCFARYETLEDAINCVIGLKDHDSIKVLPHKNKLKKAMKDTNNKEQDPQNKKWEPQNKKWEPQNKESGVRIKKVINQGAIPGQPGYNNVSNTADSDSDTSISSATCMLQQLKLGPWTAPPQYPPAQEVIIANIDPDAGIRDMFDLLKNYELIATINIKQVPNSGIRYLHAYFTTVSDAITVEKEFDKYKFFKHVLIALRPENLIEEVLYT